MLKIQIITGAVSILLLGIVLELIRRRRLKEEYSLSFAYYFKSDGDVLFNRPVRHLFSVLVTHSFAFFDCYLKSFRKKQGIDTGIEHYGLQI